MKKEYIKPQIKEHQICACRLMTGSYTPSMGINDVTISGSNSEGIIYGG
ncbi:MAG: hypothetical protein MJZ20_01075 [Bacteroidaceae bacterium]|nr:hypothetical protein [Bacteroidaceae bacterium]